VRSAIGHVLVGSIMLAALVCTIAPAIVIHPFLQRYFIHGIIVGAVKG